MDKNETQKLTDRLNETGFPFQEWCFNCVKDPCGNLLRQEFPFTFPPSSASIKTEVSSIDILGLKIPKEDIWNEYSWIYYFIECKKSKLGIKNWCFVKTSRSPEHTTSNFFIGHFYEDKIKQDINFEGRFVDHTRLFGKEIDVVIHGYEVNNKLENLNRNQEEKIYKSAMQAISACSWLESFKFPIITELIGMDLDSVKYSMKTNAERIHPNPKYAAVIFMPVLVTTSEIFVATINAGGIEEKTGEIGIENVNWEKRDSVIYDIGLPDWLQNEYSLSSSRGLIVINESAFKKFLNTNFDRINISQ